MAHGLRASLKENGRREYWGKRAGNTCSGTPRKAVRRGVSAKTITHRRERRRAAEDGRRQIID